MVTKHTFTAVDRIPDPSVDLVRICAALTSHSEVSFLISLTLPSLPDPVSALINSGATLNSWTRIWPLRQPLYWNPWIDRSHCASSMASLRLPGLSMSLLISLSRLLTARPSLSLSLGDETTPVSPDRPWPSMAAKYKSNNQLVSS